MRMIRFNRDKCSKADSRGFGFFFAENAVRRRSTVGTFSTDKKCHFLYANTSVSRIRCNQRATMQILKILSRDAAICHLKAATE